MKQALIDLLKNHPKASPIHGEVLCSALSISDVKLRALINELRIEGFPIGSTAKGYYWGYVKADLDHSIAQLFSRVKGIAKAANGLRKARKLLPENV